MPDGKVCFLARLPIDWLPHYLQLQEYGASLMGPKLELSPSDEAHLTLLYMGQVSAEVQATVESVATKVLQRSDAIVLKPMRVGTFPVGPNSDGKVPIILEYRDSPELIALTAALREKLSRYIPEETTQFSRFKAHTTIGYYRGTEDDARDLIGGNWSLLGLPTWKASQAEMSVSYAPRCTLEIGRVREVNAMVTPSRRLQKAAKRYPYLGSLLRMAGAGTISENTVQEHLVLYRKYKETADKLLALQQRLQSGEDVGVDWTNVKRELTHNLNAVKLHEMYLKDVVEEAAGTSPEAVALNLKALGTLGQRYNRAKPDLLTEDIRKTALGVRNGWALVCLDADSEHVYVDYCDLHSMGRLVGGSVLAALDMWEHAYFADFGTDKEAYIRHWLLRNNWLNAVSRMKRLAPQITAMARTAARKAGA